MGGLKDWSRFYKIKIDNKDRVGLVSTNSEGLV
jgi:hypothetical protein